MAFFLKDANNRYRGLTERLKDESKAAHVARFWNTIGTTESKTVRRHVKDFIKNNKN